MVVEGVARRIKKSKEVLECEVKKWKEGVFTSEVVKFDKTTVEEDLFSFSGDVVDDKNLLKGCGWPSPVTKEI